MKKIVLLLAVVLLAAPAMAVDTVTFTTTQVKESGGWRIYVSYDASTATSTVSGFGFDVECDSGATILDIADYKTDGFSEEGNTGLGVYLESMTWKSDPNDGVDDWGDPTADDRDSLPGIGSSGMTICMGALYDPCDIDPNPHAPGPTGQLFSFKVDMPCVITFTPDTETRGGTVMADGSVANTPVFCHVVAWNFPSQPWGDTNDDGASNFDDWIIFRDAFLTDTGDYSPPPGGVGEYHPGADLTQDGSINFDDWIIFRDNFLGTLPTTGTQTGTWPLCS
jgi:hypothetical protein